MMYAFVDASSVGHNLEDHYMTGADLVRLGEKIKAAMREQYTPIHPENPAIRSVANLVLSNPLVTEERGKATKNATIVMPGCLDRSPYGTGTCARMAVLHARGLLEAGESWVNKSMINTESVGRIVKTTKVGDYEAIMMLVESR